MAARRFMLRHLDACAMLRCLGLTQNQVTAMYLIEFLLVGLAGSVVGVLVGFGGHWCCWKCWASWCQRLPPVSLLPALQGVATGMLLLLGFALPPILQLRNVPHNRVIRREQEPPQALALATYGLGIAGFVALLLWQAGDVKLALLHGAGFLGASPVRAGGLAGHPLAATLRGASITRAGASPSPPAAPSGRHRDPGGVAGAGPDGAAGADRGAGDLMTAWRNATPPMRRTASSSTSSRSRKTIARAWPRRAWLRPSIR
jgi:putative ABC transport system permease protein